MDIDTYAVVVLDAFGRGRGRGWLETGLEDIVQCIILWEGRR
jgi:hypothetical protein